MIKTDLQKMGVMATRLPVSVAYSRAGKVFYDLYYFKAVVPVFKAKLRIFCICRLWQGRLDGVKRSWNGFPEEAGWLELFYSFEEAQQELARLRSRPYYLPEKTWNYGTFQDCPIKFMP